MWMILDLDTACSEGLPFYFEAPAKFRDSSLKQTTTTFLHTLLNQTFTDVFHLRLCSLSSLYTRGIVTSTENAKGFILISEITIPYPGLEFIILSQYSSLKNTGAGYVKQSATFSPPLSLKASLVFGILVA